MPKLSFSTVCYYDYCNESSPMCSTPYTLIVWLLDNRWEVAWHYESADAEPFFRVRCPEHWDNRDHNAAAD